MNRIAMNVGVLGTARLIAGAGAIGLTLLAGATSTASAAVVVHDNTDGTFQWIEMITFEATLLQQGNSLDITKPPTQDGLTGHVEKRFGVGDRVRRRG